MQQNEKHKLKIAEYKQQCDEWIQQNNEINDKLTSKVQENNELKKEIDFYMKECEELNGTVNLMNGTSQQINTLNLAELSGLENKLLNGIMNIQQAREHLLDNNKCIACKDNKKNISFIDGCNHIALCGQCEVELQSKLCPICQAPYTNVRKMNF